MLNQASGYQEGTGEAAPEKEEPSSAEGLFRKLQGWFRRDFNSKGQVAWRKDAREDFDFEAGEQLSEEDKAVLTEAKRPIVIFNRVGVTVDAVTGQEIGNRHETQYLPRTQGDVKKNELLTSAAKWFRQECDAEDEESDAFRDMVICGMGWTETRLDYEDNPEGDPRIERRDPLEIVWDSSATKRNLADGRRIFHIKRNIPIEDARALCPGDPKRPFTDAEYNASWVANENETTDGDPHHVTPGEEYTKEAKGDEEEDGVTMVRAQWWEREPAYLVLDPFNSDSILTLNQEQFDDLSAKAKVAGGKLRFTKTTRKVYRQAYLGNVLLEIGDAPCKGHFSFQCMTGKRDRNKNTFYGIVRAMKDPARWSNKWMSQTMHIMNTSAKGGIAAERGKFFDDDAQGEASWAKNDQVTYLKDGALSGQNPKFIEKPVSQFPASAFQLMQFAVQSLPQVSGVNAEALGMSPVGDQAAALDRQRKQSALTILQPIFASLRRYRKNQGRVLLYLIENFLSDGRLIKIEGEEGAQFVPLIKQGAQNGMTQYDVIVGDSPTSENQKEMTWALLQQILPVIGKMLPPQTWLALLKYSPLPSTAQKDIADSLEKAGEQPDPEQQKRDAELKLENDKAQAKLANDKAASDAKIQAMREESAAQIELEREKAQSDALIKALTAPQQQAVGPDGQPVAAAPGAGVDTAALILGFMQEMRRDMGALAAALNRPKQLIRNEAGDIVGIAPMGAN